MMNKKKATVKELQILCGFLNFICKAVFPGRTFVRRMYSKYSHVIKLPMNIGRSEEGRDAELSLAKIYKLKQHHHVRLDKEFNYHVIWKLFCKFLICLDYRPPNWADRLTLFVGYLVQQKKQSSTVRSYISAIKSILKDIDINIAEDQYLLSS